MKEYYHRHLPHWAPTGRPVFVTWNLKGALPSHVLNEIARFRAAKRKIDGGNEAERSAAAIFKMTDDYLDKSQEGPLWLRDDNLAKIVTETILQGAEKWYDLFAFVVMANHVHLLLTPLVELERITGGIKKKTARELNGLLKRTGTAFWQDESFDHWLRTDEELLKIVDYIENNPVKACLCTAIEAWPWSSAKMRGGWDRGSAYVQSPR